MALHDDVSTLARLPAFAALEPDALRLIAFSAEARILRAGDRLYQRGEPSDGAFVLFSGSVVTRSGTGRETIVPAPALLGEAALVTETYRPTDALAREPSSVLKVPRALYRRVLGEYPRTALRLRSEAAARLATLQRDLAGYGRSATG